MVVSERMLKELDVEPIARLKSYHVSRLEPRIMGVGPIYAVPEALKKAGLTKADIATYELNEAFASQSVAVLRELDLDPKTVNVHGGAIALGHPLGAPAPNSPCNFLMNSKPKTPSTASSRCVWAPAKGPPACLKCSDSHDNWKPDSHQGHHGR